MTANRQKPEPPDLRHYEKNRSKFPQEEIAKYWGKHVAFSLEGTHIVASGETEEELEVALLAAGIPFNQVVWSYIDGPDASRI